MIPSDFLRVAIEPALSLLPALMDAMEAKAFLVAVALQESGLTSRRQFKGPARSYVQFELTGLEGVLTHPTSARSALALCLALDIGPTAPAVYEAVEFHDVLAAGMARLLLWRMPRALPRRDQPDEAWSQYLALWLPGRPRPERWEPNFVEAWAVVQS